MTDFIALEDKYALNVYPKRQVVLTRGSGSLVWDINGKEYIDCIGGNGVATIGHCNPVVQAAIAKQAAQLMICPGTFYNDQRSLLLEKLVNLAPASLKKAFLCNSGAESIEAAIKFARFSTKRKEFVCAMRGFHGRTMGALAATHKALYRQGFEPLPPGFSHIPFNKPEKLDESVSDRTAGVILEIVQGEGGIHVGSQEYFEAARRLCDERGALLIIDEVQTGFCKTGKMFASEHFNLQPDIMCLAKAMAGGIPMAAVVCSDKVDIPVGRHGSTFGGFPLACAAACASIDFMLEHKLDEEARKKGEYFAEKFNDLNLPNVRALRQLGLMIGIELKEKSQPYIVKLMEAGVLGLPAGSTVLRLLPALTIEYNQLDVVLSELKSALA